eukprot:15415639-Alexandrium_andersonii.AAC.1
MASRILVPQRCTRVCLRSACEAPATSPARSGDALRPFGPGSLLFPCCPPARFPPLAHAARARLHAP